MSNADCSHALQLLHPASMLCYTFFFIYTTKTVVTEQVTSYSRRSLMA